jgi:hypothetical protein
VWTARWRTTRRSPGANYGTNESIFPSAGDERVEIRTAKDVTGGEQAADFVVEAVPRGGVTTPFAERVTARWTTVGGR